MTIPHLDPITIILSLTLFALTHYTTLEKEKFYETQTRQLQVFSEDIQK